VSWHYDKSDVGILLFDACLRAGAPMRFETGMRVLEIGSCESDWLERAHDAWPGVVFAGIDVRGDKHNRPYRWKRNVMDAGIFQPETFDAIVSLSAIEHIGLGHYGDPLELTGDIIAMTHAWSWLKPGGWMYFDVPYDPTGYRVQGTKCRVYDDAGIYGRLAPARDVVAWTGYVEHQRPGDLIPKPALAVQPFHYVALVLNKPPRKAD
jgi:hypothetical protein